MSPTSPSLGRRLLRVVGRIVKWGAIGFALLLVCVAVYGRVLHAREAGRWKAPGQLLAVEPGRNMHMYCTGTGKPTVVLEAGLGDFSLSSWRSVQPQISAFTRVCSYDRAGTGWSDVSRAPLMPTAMVNDLHALLGAAGERPPFVLAGHSLGGPLVRHYAVHYPSEVAGLVLVDGSHEDQLTRINFPWWADYIYPVFRGVNFLRIDRVLGGLIAKDTVAQRSLALTSTTTAVNNTMTIGQSLPTFMAAVKKDARDFGDLPITALTAGRMGVVGMTPAQADTMQRAWNAMHQEIVARTTRGRWILAEKSQHYIQRDQPELVIDAVRVMVDSVRASTKE
ncbi:MAG: alpha/beta hydrolase [Cytophagaceae bacterium]|nr:alpha/beta hydrolase [Gemmatimonadaceae bacterium]